MNSEFKFKLLDHISRIEFNIRRLHEQAHTGVFRLDSGYAGDSLSRLTKIKEFILEQKTND